MEGTTLGHYRVLELLGKGGMGEVYLAEDTKLGRRVALKVIRGLSTDAATLQRFDREARVAASLNHPNIVTIYSVEEHEGTPFLTLELIEGALLSAHIPKGGMPLDRLLSLAIPLTDAVGAAHQRGIVHRDLKPGNVMVDRAGRPKVLDFGLAKVVEEARDSLATARSTMERSSGTGIVGTGAYMSPEQIEGRAADARSDVFALGLILFEMATGERPFKGLSRGTLPSLIDRRPDLPPDFARVVNRALSTDPEDRYQTAKDLRNDLRALSAASASGTTPLSARTAPRPRRRVVAAVAVVLLLAAAIAGVVLGDSLGLFRGDARVPFASITVDSLRLDARDAALSPDGRLVAYTDSDACRIWVRETATPGATKIMEASDTSCSRLEFNHDGTAIYYRGVRRAGGSGSQADGGAIYRVPLIAGGSQLIVEDAASGPAVSPDGSRIAFIRRLANGERRVMTAVADGSAPRGVVTLRAARGTSDLAWSPEGRQLAIVSGVPGIWIVDVESGTIQQIDAAPFRVVESVAWIANGRALMVTAVEAGPFYAAQVWRVDYPTGRVTRITDGTGEYYGIAASRDGRSMLAGRRASGNELRLSAVDGRTDSRVWAGQLSASMLYMPYPMSWTPDGRMVFDDIVDGNPDVYMVNADGTGRRRLTTAPGSDSGPLVSADGRVIVYFADRELWRMDLDGRNARMLTREADSGTIAISTDSKAVYYAVGRSAVIRRLPLDGGDAVTVYDPSAPQSVWPSTVKMPAWSGPGLNHPQPSPDGRWIAFPIREGGKPTGTGLISLDGRGTFRHFPDGFSEENLWTPDGKALVYRNVTTLSPAGGIMRLLLQPIDGGPARQLAEVAFNSGSGQITKFAVSPDLTRLAMVTGRFESDWLVIRDTSR